MEIVAEDDESDVYAELKTTEDSNNQIDNNRLSGTEEQLEEIFVMFEKENLKEELTSGDVRSKLVALIHRHVENVTRAFVDDLLLVLRSENHKLPKY